jgi:hypothetical protein
MLACVFRIQNADGTGPYRGGAFDRDGFRIVDAHWKRNRDRALWAEIAHRAVIELAAPSEIVGYGCRTLHQLFDWFCPGEHRYLAELGFNVVRLKADRILEEGRMGTGQVFFARCRPLNVGATVIPWATRQRTPASQKKSA